MCICPADVSAPVDSWTVGTFVTCPCQVYVRPGDHFAKSLWAHNPNPVKICVALMQAIIIRSGHNFAHAMTAKLSWLVQNCNLIRLLETTLDQNVFTLHKIWFISSWTFCEMALRDGNLFMFGLNMMTLSDRLLIGKASDLHYMLMVTIHSTYEDIGARGRYLGHGEVITSHMIIWNVISYPYSRYLLSATKSLWYWIYRTEKERWRSWKCSHSYCLISRLFLIIPRWIRKR